MMRIGTKEILSQTHSINEVKRTTRQNKIVQKHPKNSSFVTNRVLLVMNVKRIKNKIDLHLYMFLRGSILCLISILVVSFHVNSQEFVIKNYTQADGLPSDQVYDIYQDKNGLIWFATDRGIASFNGSDFEVYAKDEGLPNNVVYNFFPQKDGTIWCTTLSNELFYFHPDTAVIHKYQFNKKLSNYPSMVLKHLYIDPDKNIFLNSHHFYGYIQIDKNGKITKKHRSWINLKDKVTSERLLFVKCQKLNEEFSYFVPVTSKLSGNYYQFPNSYRMHNYSQGDAMYTAGFEYLNFYFKEKLIKSIPIDYSKNKILNIGLHDDGVWMSTFSGGLNVYTKQGELLYHFLNGTATTNYIEDSEGGCWIATLTKGVYRVSNPLVQKYSFADNEYVYSLTNQHGNLIVGCLGGNVYSMQQQKQVHLLSSTPQAQVYQYYNSVNKLLNGGIHGLDKFIRKFSNNKEELPLAISISTISSENDDRLLTYQNGQRIWDAEYYGKEIIFAGTKGLFMLKNGKVSPVKDESRAFRVNDVDVLNKCYFSATDGNGLVITNYFGKNYVINSKNGLQSDYVNEVVIENQSTIWVCTSKGLNRLKWTGKEWEISSLTRERGLTHNEITNVEIIENTLYVGTKMGLCSFDKTKWKKISKTFRKANIQLKSILVNDLHLPDAHSLTYDQNRIEFRFEAVSFSENKNLQFRYKMLGVEDKWNFTNERIILYKQLQPGKYTLIVHPLINEKATGEEIIYSFTISPPYYKTWWFYLSIFIAIATLVWLFFRYRILTYNRKIIEEILHLILKKLKKKSTTHFVVRSSGHAVKIDSTDVLYVESSGNYIYIVTENKRIVVREKISNFEKMIPDPKEYIQIRRSLIIRTEKVTSKSVNSVTIKDVELKVGKTYLPILEDIIL